MTADERSALKEAQRKAKRNSRIFLAIKIGFFAVFVAVLIFFMLFVSFYDVRRIVNPIVRNYKKSHPEKVEKSKSAPANDIKKDGKNVPAGSIVPK